MEITFDELVVLSNTPKESDTGNKSEIALNTALMLQHPYIDQMTISSKIDELVHKGYINKDTSQKYTISDKGRKTLKSNYEAVQLLMLNVYMKVTNV